jgi:hypothetical protein
MGREGQRFHHNRQHGLVSPGVTGLVFTVDPNQVGKAIREMQLYLDRFRGLMSVGDETAADDGAGDEAHNGNSGAACESVSALLAAELAEFRKGPPLPEGQGDHPSAKPRPKRNQILFSILETHCKGYIFVNVTRPRDENPRTLKRLRDDIEEEEDVSSHTSINASDATECPQSSRPFSGGSKTFFINDRVPQLVEAIFSELEAHPCRPVSRFTYRMFPCAISCCPVTGAMTQAIKDLAERIPPIPGRSAIKIGFHFSVKNNSNVEREKVKLRSDLEGCMPHNRFLVLPCGRKGIELDGVFHVLVLHSTCTIGYAPNYSARRDYNVHDFGRDGGEKEGGGARETGAATVVGEAASGTSAE